MLQRCQFENASLLKLICNLSGSIIYNLRTPNSTKYSGLCQYYLCQLFWIAVWHVAETEKPFQKQEVKNF